MVKLRARSPLARSLRQRPAVEVLEDRLVPTAGGTVLASLNGGELTLTGDASDNQVTIFETSTQGQYVVSTTGTTLGGGTSVTVDSNSATVTGVTSIDVNMGAASTGGDTVTFSAATPTAVSVGLTGTLSVTSSGGLTVNVDANGINNLAASSQGLTGFTMFVPSGTSSTPGFVVQGVTTINHDNSSALVVNVGTVGGASSTALSGGLVVFSGAGGGAVNVQGGVALGFLSDNVAGGTNSLNVSDSTIHGFVSFTDTSKPNSPSGSDAVYLGANSNEQGTVTIGENTFVDFGDSGTDILSIGSTSSSSVNIGGSLTTSGSGAQTLLVGLSSLVDIGNYVSINTPEATTGTNVVLANMAIGNFLSIETGSGAANIVLFDEHVATQTAIFMGGSNNSLAIADCKFLGLTFADTLLGAFDVRAQSGNNVVAMESGETFSAGPTDTNSLTPLSTVAGNTADLTVPNFSGSDGINTQIAGTASFALGNGTNTLALGNPSLPGFGDQIVFYGSVNVHKGTGTYNTDLSSANFLQPNQPIVGA